MAIAQAFGKTMPPQAVAPPPGTTPREGELGHLMRSFDRSLRTLKRSKLTRDQYLMSVGQMVDSWPPTGCPTTRRRSLGNVETFLADFTEGHKPATVQTRYECLRLFFSFLLEEREISVHPMANMRPPSILERPSLSSAKKSLGRCSRRPTAVTSWTGGTPPFFACSSTPACAGASWRG